MKKNIFVLLLLCLVYLQCGAINWIRRVDMKDGISENYICDIVSDSQGFIYIATKLGIDIFDGNRISQLSVSYPELFHPERIVFDSKGGLWSVWKDSLWLYDGRGFTNDEVAMKRAAKSAGFVLPEGSMSDLATHSGRLAYVSPDGSLYYTDNIKVKARKYKGLARNHRKVSLGRDGKVWLFDGMTDGLAYVDFASPSPVLTEMPRFKDILVKDVECTPGGKVLVATNNNGLFVLDHQGNEMENLMHDSDDPVSISSNHLSSLMVRNGYLYTGTTKKGLHIAQIHPLHVTSINTGIDHDISFFHEDKSSKLLIGFDGGGLALYDKPGDTSPLRHYTESNSSIPSDLVIGVSKGDGSKLFCTYGGGIFTLEGGNVKELYDADSLRFCRQIVRLSDGQLVAATFTCGLAVIGKKMLTFENSPLQTNAITCLEVLGKRLLAGTATGLCVYDPASGKMSLVDNDKLKRLLVTDMHVDRHGFVWVGSPEGLIVLNPRLEPIAKIDRTSHLSANYVRAICSDLDGNIWTSTVNGINKIIVKPRGDGRFSFICLPYYSKDGIGDIDFDRHSILCLSDGRILAGGQGTYLLIDPKSAVPTDHYNKVFVTGLSVDGKRVRPGDRIRGDIVAIESHSNIIDEINLAYDHSINLDLSTLSPEGDGNNVFEYRFDDDEFWNIAQGPTLNIGPLSGGRHILHVRKVGSETVSDIVLKVRPPFWMSWWAYLLYCLIAVIAIVLTARYIMSRNRKRIYGERIEQTFKREENAPLTSEELFLSKARQLVIEHMSEDDFSVESLADLMSMSRSNLYKKISKASARTPVEFIRIIRLREGRRMLDSGETSISQIAYSVGMSPKFFSKSFKEEYGVSPSKYVPETRRESGADNEDGLS